MSSRYIKIWLLEDMILSYDRGDKGATAYWKVLKEYKDGDVLIQHNGNKALLTADDLKKGERHSKANFYNINGLHLGIETGYKRKWYGKFYRETANL